MKRTSLEYFFRKITDKFGLNFRFHRYGKSSREWSFEWWKRVPGNPLNKGHIMDYNVGWPIPKGSYQPCKRRKQYTMAHPDINEYFLSYGNIPKDGELDRSDCHKVKLGCFASKDDAIFAAMSHPDFMKYCGFCMPVHSIEELYMMLDLIGIEYDTP